MSAENKKPGQKSPARKEIDACFARIAPESGPLDGQVFEGAANEEGKTTAFSLALKETLIASHPPAFPSGPTTSATASTAMIVS